MNKRWKVHHRTIQQIRSYYNCSMSRFLSNSNASIKISMESIYSRLLMWLMTLAEAFVALKTIWIVPNWNGKITIKMFSTSLNSNHGAMLTDPKKPIISIIKNSLYWQKLRTIYNNKQSNQLLWNVRSK